MLTREDLEKIGQVLDRRLDTKLDQFLDEKLEKKFKSFRFSFLVSVRRMLRKETNSIIKHFDGTTTNHERRIKRIEQHIQLPPMVDL